MGNKAPESPRSSARRHQGAVLRRLVIHAVAAGVSAIYSLALDLAALLRRPAAKHPTLDLPEMDLGQFGDRLLVVAPHPDDETLGCGGIIRSLAERGVAVRVVFLTNGDGYWAAAGSEARGLRWGPDSYLDLGRRREREARAAARQLGLQEDSLEFYGFPDRGLSPLWTSFFDEPFQSPYTRAGAPPYASSALRGCSYTGASLLSGLGATLEHFKPTSVLVPHPLDDHPDHSAAYAFTTAALFGWGQKCQIFTYLVHRGHWPYPGRRSHRNPLEPPKPLLSVGTHWSAVSLSGQQVQNKQAVLACYPSQTSLMKDFLRSFIRSNELVGQVASVVAGSEGSEAEPQFIQPTKDTLTRKINRGADISRLWVSADGGTLRLRIETAGKLERGSTARIHLRSFANGNPRTISLLYGKNGVTGQVGTELRTDGRTLEAKVPLESLGYSEVLWVGVKTSRFRVNVDSTGWQPVHLNSGNDTKPQTYPPDQ